MRNLELSAPITSPAGKFWNERSTSSIENISTKKNRNSTPVCDPSAEMMFLSSVRTGNTNEGSITVPLTSCLTGLESTVWQLTIFVFICKTDSSKPVKQEVNITVILPPLVFPGKRTPWALNRLEGGQTLRQGTLTEREGSVQLTSLD